MRTRGLLGVIFLGLVVCGPSLAAVPGAATPEAGPASSAAASVDAWWHDWTRDADGDGIDDAIKGIEAGLLPLRRGDDLPFYAARETPDGLRYDVFVRFADTPSGAAIAEVARTMDRSVQAYAWAGVVYVRDVPAHGLRALLEVPGVRGIELERTVVPAMDHAIPAMLVNRSDEFGKGARDRWKVNGDGVGIAFLDTGIDQEHAAFDPTRFLGGYDATVPLATTGAGPATTTPLNERDPDDRSDKGHGTHVASLAVADHANDTFIGVAPRASYLDVKVLLETPDGSVGTTSTHYGIGSTVLEGLDFVRRYNAGESHLGEPREAVRIISLSVGETSPDPNGSSALSHAVNRISDEGLVVVAAAGNCGPAGNGCEDAKGNETVTAPGAAKRAITVGAMDGKGTIDWADDEITAFSSRGPNGGEPKPNLVAFGANIRGARNAPQAGEEAREGARTLSGTSVATPFVAGIAALILQANGTLGPDEVKELLTRSARDVGPSGWDNAHGEGVANAYFAVGVAVGVLDLETTRIDSRGHDIPDLELPKGPEPPPEPKAPRRANLPPIVRFVNSPSAPLAGEEVVFADRSSDPEGHGLVSWRWDFGDGETGKGERTVHVYDRPGTYRVRLTVTDINGTGESADSVLVVGAVAGMTEEAPAGGGIWMAVALGAFALAHWGRRGGGSARAITARARHPRHPRD